MREVLLRRAPAILRRGSTRSRCQDGSDCTISTRPRPQHHSTTAVEATHATPHDVILSTRKRNEFVVYDTPSKGPDAAGNILQWRKGTAKPQRLPDRVARHLDQVGAYHKQPGDFLRSMCDMEHTLERHERKLQHHWEFLRNIHKLANEQAEHGNSSNEQRIEDTRAWNIELLNAQTQSVQKGLIEETWIEPEEGDANEPQTQDQLQVHTDMINRLVDKLMWQAHIQEHADESPDRLEIMFERDAHWRELQRFRNQGFPRYVNPSEQLRFTATVRRSLNHNFRDLFNTWRDYPLKTRVANLCSNLLALKVPPGIHNYNALLFGLTTMGQHDLADIVAESFLNDSRMQATEQTYICLMLHYQGKGDLKGFYNVLRRLTGISARGLLDGGRHQTPVKGKLLSSPTQSPIGITASMHGEALAESYSSEVMNAIMSGLLLFDRIKDAAKAFVLDLSTNGQVNHGTLRALLWKCLYNLDDAAAKILMQGLAVNIDQSTDMLLDAKSPARLSEQLQDVLSLLIASNLDEHAVELALSIHPASTHSSTGTTRKLGLTMFMQNLSSHLERVERTIKMSRTAFKSYRINASRSVTMSLKHFTALEAYYPSLEARRSKTTQLGKLRSELQLFSWNIGKYDIIYKFHHVMLMICKMFPNRVQPCATTTAAAEAFMRYRLESIANRLSPGDQLIMEINLELAISWYLDKVTKWHLFGKHHGRDPQWAAFAALESEMRNEPIESLRAEWAAKRRWADDLEWISWPRTGKSLPLPESVVEYM